MARSIFYLICLLILPCDLLLAEDEWSVDGIGQHPPDRAANRIIKWCSNDGTHIRFASANLKIKGYKPCGTLETQASCDASGKRLISKDSSRPEGHLDCGVGPRMLIINHGKKEHYSSASFHDEDPEIQPLTQEENEQLKKEIASNKALRGKTEAERLQQFTQTIVTAFFGKSPGNSRQPLNRRQSAKDLRESQAELKRLLDSLDPNTQKMLKEAMGLK